MNGLEFTIHTSDGGSVTFEGINRKEVDRILLEMNLSSQPTIQVDLENYETIIFVCAHIIRFDIIHETVEEVLDVQQHPEGREEVSLSP